MSLFRVFTITYGTFDVPAIYHQWFFFSFCFNRTVFDNCNWAKLDLKNGIEIFWNHQNCEVIPFSTWAISSNAIYKCVALCFFFAWCLSQFQLWIAFPTNVRTRLFDCPATFRKSCDSFYSSDISAIVFCALAIWRQLLTLPIEKSLTCRGFEFFSNRKSAILFHWHFWW